MVFVDFFFALVVALLFTFIFVTMMRRSGPWESFVLFFVVLFLIAWAGGAWVVPFGPVLWGSPFLSFLVVGLIAALLLAAVPPRVEEPARREVLTGGPETRGGAVVGAFLWLFIFAMLVGIALHYLLHT